MAIPQAPLNFNVQTANQQTLVSWDQSVGATSYIVERSLDNVTYTTLTTITGTPLATQYLDTSVLLGVQYWFRVSASNLDGTHLAPTYGTSGPTTPQAATSTPTGEMCLSQIRLAAQQRADRVNSNFVTDPEWRQYINQSMFELYDLLVTVYEDLYVATPISFSSPQSGTQFLFPLPNGSNTFLNALTNVPFIPDPFYKLIGMDLAINNATNAYVSLTKFNFADRNKFIYPNTTSTIYGVYNMRYRLLGLNQIELIPAPAGNQQFRVWYIPRLKELLLDTDTTNTGISGWIEYVIVRAAKFALDKEESDSSVLTQEIAFLKARIEETASNRDAGMPDTISDIRQNYGNGNGWGPNGNGSFGGW